jgi:hypothetical protein
MLGVKLVFPYGYGAFFGSLEGVYTDPYHYKRDGDVEYMSHSGKQTIPPGKWR